MANDPRYGSVLLNSAFLAFVINVPDTMGSAIGGVRVEKLPVRQARNACAARGLRGSGMRGYDRDAHQSSAPHSLLREPFELATELVGF